MCIYTYIYIHIDIHIYIYIACVYIYIYIYTHYVYIYVCIYIYICYSQLCSSWFGRRGLRARPRALPAAELLLRGGGRVLLTEMPLPRIARPGTCCLISIRGQARKTRIEKLELDEGFQPHHPALPSSVRSGVRASRSRSPAAAAPPAYYYHHYNHYYIYY